MLLQFSLFYKLNSKVSNSQAYIIQTDLFVSLIVVKLNVASYLIIKIICAFGIMRQNSIGFTFSSIYAIYTTCIVYVCV